MAKPLIQIRPSGQFDLRPEEMDCITWVILSGCPKEDAFLKFVRPDYIGSKATAAMKDAVKQFFAMADVQKYADAYRSAIKKLLDKEERNFEDIKKPQTLEERKARAKTKLVEFAMNLADNIDQADDPEFVLKMADKCDLLGGDEEVEEVPRRYLPTSCLVECRYRAFCENPDNVEDLCQFCKYHQYGEENGVHYDSMHQLSLPPDSGTELEGTQQAKNNE